jgi:hypothetical protein
MWGRLFARKETKVLILGLDNAGKVSSEALGIETPELIR